jgi:ATP-dependent protease ClpP protease subunit
MHIMSGGGKVYAGLAILDVMRSLTSPVHTTCIGHCESMAAVRVWVREYGGGTCMGMRVWRRYVYGYESMAAVRVWL